VHRPEQGNTTIWGVGGGTGSGKTTFVGQLIDRLGVDVAVLSFDAYYHDLDHLPVEERALANFDHPDSLDFELFTKHLDRLRRGETADVPRYDFATHTRSGPPTPLEAKPLVIAEGILLLSFEEIVERLDLTLFLDVPAAVRFERRLARDVAERGRDPEGVRRQWESTVAPMHDEFVQPGAALADQVIGHGAERESVLEALCARLELAA